MEIILAVSHYEAVETVKGQVVCCDVDGGLMLEVGGGLVFVICVSSGDQVKDVGIVGDEGDEEGVDLGG